MKKFATIRNVLIAISFTVFLLFVKDNIDVVWNIICKIAEILTPFLVGFLFAYLLNFPYKFFYTKAFGKMGTKHKVFAKMKKPLALVCTYTLVFAIFISIIWIVFPQLIENLASLVETMPTYYESVTQHLNEFVDWLNSTFNAGIEKDNIINELLKEIFKLFSIDNITQVAGKTGEVIFGMVLSTTSGFYNFVMGIVISVYFLAAKEQLCRLVKRLAVAFIPIKYLPKIYEIIDITDTKCGRFLVGDIIDAAFVGLLTFVAMVILNVPYAPLIAVLIGVTNIIPFFGPFIGAIPSAFLLFIINPWDMIKFIIIVVIIQQLDGNLFKPKIIGNQVGLSSFWVLFSVIVGGALFGLPGFILGTPIFAVIYSLVRKRANNAIDEKGKIAQEALDFEVLNYQKIAEEQKRIREEKENQQREKIKKLIGLNKSEHDKNDDSDSEESDINEKKDNTKKK